MLGAAVDALHNNLILIRQYAQNRAFRAGKVAADDAHAIAPSNVHLSTRGGRRFPTPPDLIA
jgi:hypothetical protein